MLKFFQKIFSKADVNDVLPKVKAKDVPFSLSQIQDKGGNLPMADILGGKYSALAVKENIPGVIYEVTHVLPKTGTEVTYKVDRNGRLLAKEVLLGEGNSASSIVHSSYTQYSGDYINGMHVSIPDYARINIRVPLYKDGRGFSRIYSKDSTRWMEQQPTPFNF